MSRRFLIWFWSGGGGGSQFAVHLAERLALHFGADAITLSLRADDPTIERARRSGVRTLAADVVSDRKRPLTSLRSLGASAKVLNEHADGADVVIIPMNFATAAALSATLRQPIVYCAHDPEPHPGDYAAGAQRVTQYLLLRHAKRVVALSAFAGKLLQRQGVPTDKLVVAPLNSVWPVAPAPAPRAPGPIRLLFAGRMIAYKGLDLFADALDVLSDRSRLRLTLAGAGPALGEALVARYRALGAAVQNDWLDESSMDSLFAGADAIVAPYQSATQSGVVSQSIACGRPCLVTPVGALREQVAEGRAGWIATSTTAPAIAEALETILRAPGELTEKSRAATTFAQTLWGGDYWSWLGSL